MNPGHGANEKYLHTNCSSQWNQQKCALTNGQMGHPVCVWFTVLELTLQSSWLQMLIKELILEKEFSLQDPRLWHGHHLGILSTGPKAVTWPPSWHSLYRTQDCDMATILAFFPQDPRLWHGHHLDILSTGPKTVTWPPFWHSLHRTQGCDMATILAFSLQDPRLWHGHHLGILSTGPKAVTCPALGILSTGAKAVAWPLSWHSLSIGPKAMTWPPS